jgi:hypothetical protein
VKREGFLLVAGAAVAGAVVAAAAMRRRKVDTKAHPLQQVLCPSASSSFQHLLDREIVELALHVRFDIEMAQAYQASA